MKPNNAEQLRIYTGWPKKYFTVEL